MQTVLLTGATGFIGSRLVQRLLRDSIKVHVLIRPSSALTELTAVEDQITCHVYDGEIDSLIQSLAKIQPDVVIHLATLFIAQHHSQDILPLIESNLLFPTQLLEAMARNHIKHFINAGTGWEHFNDKPYDPVSLYAATKQAFENLMEYYVQCHHFNVITLKLFDTYGPNDPRKKLIPKLLETLKHQQTLSMSPGEQEIDLVHIDDVVEAFYMAAQRVSTLAKQHERYGVSSGRPLTVKELVGCFEKIVGRAISVQWGVTTYREREVMKTARHLPTLPGWKPLMSLEQGLRSLFVSQLR